MSFSAIGFVVLAVWAVIGLVTSWVMRRRGHDLFSWLILGAVFGPLVIPLAVDAIVTERRAEAHTLAPGAVVRATRGLRVLVGIDGSPESHAAVRAAVALFGDRVTHLALARVVDYDTALGSLPEGARHAEADLRDAAAVAPAWSPELVTLPGRPAEALAAAARDGDYDVLVVGARGRGAAKAILGSVASRLARGAGVPVLVVGEQHPVAVAHAS